MGADAVLTWKGTGRSWLEEELYKALPMARVLFYDHGDVGETDDLIGLADRLLSCIGGSQVPSLVSLLLLCARPLTLALTSGRVEAGRLPSFAIARGG